MPVASDAASELSVEWRWAATHLSIARVLRSISVPSRSAHPPPRLCILRKRLTTRELLKTLVASGRTQAEARAIPSLPLQSSHQHRGRTVSWPQHIEPAVETCGVEAQQPLVADQLGSRAKSAPQISFAGKLASARARERLSRQHTPSIVDHVRDGHHAGPRRDRCPVRGDNRFVACCCIGVGATQHDAVALGALFPA